MGGKWVFQGNRIGKKFDRIILEFMIRCKMNRLSLEELGQT